ncbi:Abi-alpha family protein [Flavobacterium gelidilacus]|uniref:Abi-alpha family protein n=1 Tax=Flavobacterium gelidilacus TaxID=206041 RepID=UPI0003FD9829|nr:Abi-alpha family protein [Flavobacterium gelidilacus]
MSDEKKIELANGIGIAAEKALEFIEKMIAAPIMEGTGIFTDKIKYWRFKNQVTIIEKARQFLKEKGIDVPKKIPIKDVTTLLEYASFEEDEIMQDSWAKLLANTLDPKNQFNACHIFSQLLNQLSIDDFHIIKFIFSKSFFMSSEDRPYFEKIELVRNSSTDYQTTMLIIDNLLRLRLIEEQPPKLKENSRSVYLYNEDEKIPENEIISSECYRLSKFGVELVRQVTE